MGVGRGRAFDKTHPHCKVALGVDMNGTRAKLKLSDFDISEATGFVPSDRPLDRLPADCFASWEDVVSSLPTLVKEKRIRHAIHRLPMTDFSEATIKSEEEWRRAYVVLCFLSQAYLWVEGEAGLPEKVPKVLAIPWCRVSDHLGLPPVITYASSATFNLALRDEGGPLDSNNAYCRVTFTGTEDESWFYLVALLVELASVPALNAIVSACSAVVDRNSELLCRDLVAISKSLEEATSVLARMYERCDPMVFYTKIRPFQAGSKGLDAFPNGLIYEGVDPLPRKYHGASAGQAPTIHAYDVFFRAKHFGADEDFLHAMRKHMPPNHRAFLLALAEQPSVRDYILQTGDAKLVQSFNTAVKSFTEFRSQHIVLVTRYIVMQKHLSQNASLDMKGTGGTDFMQFLKHVRDDTASLEISW